MKELGKGPDWISGGPASVRGRASPLTPPSTCSFCFTIPPPAAASSYLAFDLSSVASGPVPRSHIHLILILSISRCFSAAVAIQRRPCLPFAYKGNMAPNEFLLPGKLISTLFLCFSLLARKVFPVHCTREQISFGDG